MKRFLQSLLIVPICLACLCSQVFAADDLPTPTAEKIAEWRKDAEKGDAKAQFNLGISYENGKGVPKDFMEAAKWYQKAADQGHDGAQYNLGVCYAKGEGVPKDMVMAYMWFKLSSANGYKDSPRLRDLVAELMTPEQIAEAQKLSREWKPRK